jgi:hypothetical protein
MESDGCHIDHLFTKTRTVIAYHNIAKIYVDEGPAAVLVFNDSGKEKTMHLKCPNAPAIVDCVQNVIQVLYKMQQQAGSSDKAPSSKKPPKSPRSEFVFRISPHLYDFPVLSSIIHITYNMADFWYRSSSGDKSPRKEKSEKPKKSPKTSPRPSNADDADPNDPNAKPLSATPRLSDDGLVLMRPKADSITGGINVSTSSRRRSTLDVPDK